MIKNKKRKLNKGFTLVEMLVVISIVVIITVVVLGSYPVFASQFSLSRVAREIALELRQSQVFGLAVREFPSEDDVYPPYGISISLDDPSRSPVELVLFGDYCDAARNCDEPLEENFNGNGIYQEFEGCGATDPDRTECVSVLRITKDAELENVCVVEANETRRCWDDGNGPGTGELEDLHVSFKRPEPEAIIKMNADDSVVYNSAEIVIRSVRFPDKKKMVRVWITGQISTQDYE